MSCHGRRYFVLGSVVVVAAWSVVAARQRQLQKRRRVALSVGCEYLASSLREALARLNIVEDAAAPCQWHDFAALDWDALLTDSESRHRRSSLFVRASLVRKGMLQHYIMKKRFVDVLPDGFSVDLEDEEDLESLRCRLDTWHASAKEQQEPFWVVKVIDRVREPVLEGVVEWVVQRYVAPPELLRGRKFHIRAHMLLSGCPQCGTTRAWLHREYHVALLASEQFSPQSEDHHTHITNACFQEHHPQFVRDDQTYLVGELDAMMGRVGLAEHLQARMESALSKALEAASLGQAGFATLPHCFELFGADFALENRGTSEPGVFLLEVNSGPSLAVFGPRLRSKCVCLLEDVLRLAVEPHLEMAAPQAFVQAANCHCGHASDQSGFGRCLWSAPPRTTSAADELKRMKSRLSIAVSFAKAKHELHSVPVRGPQGR